MTNAQLIKRMEEVLNNGSCVADRETYDAHCKILGQLEQTLPRMERTLEKLDKRLDEHERRLVVMETEKHVIIGIVAFIGGILGIVGSWVWRFL